ncbi:MAG: PadR family transcriptional regulator [Novosphingobium sp.]
MSRNRSLSDHARRVLATLLDAQGGWSYGYDLSKRANVKSGTLYPLLMRLESRGYLEAEWQEPCDRGRPPRHGYRLTAEGLRLARENLPGASLSDPHRPGAIKA